MDLTRSVITTLAKRAIAAASLAALVACGSERSANDPDALRLSGASNRLVNSPAWNVDQSSIEERWNEDPTVMEPDYPSMNPMPGFANQGTGPYGP
jgi:hypothetical protein